ncbi:NAD-dependent epimerase/dehydratase family protein [Lactococcus lactis subsp. lactis]|uniref:UDP-glucose 4-epimerase n=1 Tax=Lactococcus lactis subsp. lactis TaxID=1360 RepID=A0A0V8EGZ7_LACLL|nr:NAD-dependent epimerase/dehydratase family protein [Lactococcus lactis]AGY45232.2 epimerase [Lactococcus lactis subsp. lactis KLDS 4.0325]KHE77361.1 epimerase [Lactococcus lactis subsp. lactis 1AA59]KSU24943.1 UDP-glucose 4-epimerase [Lactococcus lactis subsp. lactis]KZK11501.1 UDP-glucose 4-epimerase [Lactococcus lactis subsp. lactis bv. diacetylactis]MBG1280039.1 NAD-dependent epimerase/dehydratase family protein [Lactococcus lactis subsp. lactis]
MIKNNNILITGGAGFIGSTLANALLPDNKVIVLDDLSMGDFNNLDESINLTKIEGNLVDKELLGKIFSENEFDYIFHLGAVASVADSVARPYETHQVNFDSTMTILEILRTRKSKLKRFVFSSSAAVYGDEPTLPKREESVIRPLTPYAIDKFASEKMAMIYNLLYDIPTSATRFFNVYGPNQNPESPYSGFISILVDRLKNEKELTIFGNGEQTRDFVYVEDVVNALLLIATSDKSRGQVYNVGTGSRITLNDLVKLSQEITGKKISIKFDKEREGDIRDSISDISKLRSIGYEPNVDLALGMKKYLEYEFKK